MLKIAKKEDFSIVKDLSMKFFSNSPYKDFPADDKLIDTYIESFLLDSPFRIVVLDFDGDKPTGFIGFEYGAYLFSPIGCGIEKAMWVEPEYRKKDVAKRLLQAFEDWAKELKCSILQLSTLEGEFAKTLDKFYTKMGYTKVEHTFLKEIK